MSRTQLTASLTLVVALVLGTGHVASAEIPVVPVDIGPSSDFGPSSFPATSVSGDGNWVVATASNEGGVVLWNASSRTWTLLDPTGFDPVISADGRWIAYTRILRFEKGPVNEILLKDRTSNRPAVRLSSEGIHQYPDMSSDGSVVIWRSRESPNGPFNTEVWRRSTENVEGRRSGLGIPKVSGSGRFVIHSVPFGGARRWDLATGASEALDARLDYGFADISDDGNSIAYLVHHEGFSAGKGVGVYTVAGGGDRVLDVPADESGIGVQRIAMSGDASTITFTTRQKLVADDDYPLTNTYRWEQTTGELDIVGLNPNANIVSLSTDGTAAATRDYGRHGYLRLDLLPGTVAAANSIEEILAASDYTEADANLLRLYRAFFNRGPDRGGAVYWIEISRGGSSLTEIAEFFTSVPEYRNLYGGTNDAEFLTAVYKNVLGRQFDQGGYDYWLDLLEGTNESGGNPGLETLSRGAVVRWVTGSVEFKSTYPFLPT